MSRRHVKLSVISSLHFAKLVFRSILFIVGVITYIISKIKKYPMISKVAGHPVILMIVWGVFAVEMVFRFFPSSLESMGCQKQFKGTYIPAETNRPPNNLSGLSTVLIALMWILFNAIFGVFYLIGFFDAGIMLLISLAFSVCDIICILFFCPFQTFFMRNKCCGSCRIYNWDYAMMFTPLIFVRSVYSWSLVVLALGLFIRWEITFYKHPERFSEVTNDALTCANCPEKLCHHKKQLQRFLQDNAEYIRQFINREKNT